MVLSLSKREAEIIKYVRKGYTNQGIADKLNLSIHTVKAHLYRIYAKMGINGLSKNKRMTMVRKRISKRKTITR